MFILGMAEEDYQMAIEKNDLTLLSKHLYRVQKIAPSDYVFRFHLETKLDGSSDAKEVKCFYRIKSLSAFFALNPWKLKINCLGQITVAKNKPIMNEMIKMT